MEIKTNLFDSIQEVTLDQPICQDHPGQTWCNHLRDYILQGKDADRLWDMLHDTESYGDRGMAAVCVPIIPGENIWVWLQVEPYSKDLFTVYRRGDRLDGSITELGIIGPGDSRISIFYMMIDYFNSASTNCGGMYHGFKSQLKLDADMKIPSERLRQQVNMYLHDKCTSCVDKAHDDFSDLIPDIKDKSWQGF